MSLLNKQNHNSIIVSINWNYSQSVRKTNKINKTDIGRMKCYSYYEVSIS
jgi:hypothetical protein